MNIHLVILAGGYATRLKTLSQNLPKALIKVAGKPFIFWQLELLKNQGVKNILRVLVFDHTIRSRIQREKKEKETNGI